jgi:hypothetical protein
MQINAILFSKTPELSNNQIINAHQEVINSFYELNQLIPEKYKSLNLIDIALIKSYGYHTGFDQLYYRYSRLKNMFLSLKIINEKIASKLSHKIIINHGASFSKVYSDLKIETPYYNRKSTLPNYINQDKTYNLFFSNTQTYLLVLIEYINRSDLDNHILIIPKFLKECDVLKKIDKNKVIFFEDFYNENILSEFYESKKIFSSIFDKNYDLLNNFFTIDDKEFFSVLNKGIENIFKFVLPEVLLNTLTINNILNKIKVSNLVGARVRKIYDRSFLQVGYKNDIRTYILFHSNLVKYIKSMHATGHFNNISGVFSWGKNQKKLITSDQFSSVKKIFTTGSPLFERNSESIPYKINERQSIIYACGSGDIKETKVFIESLAPIQNNNEIIVKVHPHVRHENYQKLTRGFKVKIIKGEAVFEDLLDNAKVVVTILSEASLHSMIRGIPTLFIFFEKKWDRLLHGLYDISSLEKEKLIIRSKKQLLPTVNNILNNESFRRNYIQVQQNFIERNIKIHKGLFGATKEIDKILC